MPAARTAIVTIAVLIAGTAVVLLSRPRGAVRPGRAPDHGYGVPSGTQVTMPEASETPAPAPGQSLSLAEARGMGTSDLSLRVAALPQESRSDELPELARLLAARGPDAVLPVASALATAGSDTARGVLADALALIGTDDAVQELCAAAVHAPDDSGTAAIAAAFRGLANPDIVPMLATVFSQTDEPRLLAEAGSAIRRLADSQGVLALAELMKEDGQLHSQRAALLELLRGIQSSAARPALEALESDETDPECAAAARKALTGSGG